MVTVVVMVEVGGGPGDWGVEREGEAAEVT